MKEFINRQKHAGCTQWIIEATFGNREPEVAEPNNPHHIVVRCDDEIWLKEAMINKAIQYLPHDWKYVMWLDADVEFTRSDWVMETIHALQHYPTVQPFSHAIDLGPRHESLETHTGFAFQYVNGQPYTQGYGTFWHPGYAWAWRRDAWEAVGGMIDRAVCGAADHHMALSLIGKAPYSIPGNVHPNYSKMVYDWQYLAETTLHRNLGYVPGTILHHFHGSKKKRNYVGRWNIIVDNQFDPQVDLIRDWQGMLTLAGNKPKLRDDLRAYMRSRDEDGNE
jgi:hypothetical protein